MKWKGKRKPNGSQYSKRPLARCLRIWRQKRGRVLIAQDLGLCPIYAVTLVARCPRFCLVDPSVPNNPVQSGQFPPILDTFLLRENESFFAVSRSHHLLFCPASLTGLEKIPFRSKPRLPKFFPLSSAHELYIS